MKRILVLAALLALALPAAAEEMVASEDTTPTPADELPVEAEFAVPAADDVVTLDLSSVLRLDFLEIDPAIFFAAIDSLLQPVEPTVATTGEETLIAPSEEAAPSGQEAAVAPVAQSPDGPTTIEQERSTPLQEQAAAADQKRADAEAPLGDEALRIPSPPAASAVVAVAAVGAGIGLLWWLRPSWLRWLVPLPLLTYTREALLENPTRARLLQVVEENPGIHFNGLVQELGLGRGQAEHHLRALEKARVITKQSAGGYACYFADPAAAHDLRGVVNVLKSEPARRALQFVIQNPGSRPSQVARASDMSPDSALYHIRQLAHADLISVVVA
ncbi:MAG TPA: ArsR family transcriptional regulator, partial [Candidatus Thermoplasmatota archaeon]|nr:ArsR family transcriptional regulator [Candidatus Thermoplasmatota archaeon]